MHSFENLAFETLCRFQNDHQGLMPCRCDGGRNQAPTHGQLFQPSVGHGIPASGRDDACIGCAFGIAQHAIPKNQVHVVQSERSQVGSGLFGQAAQALDAVNLGGDVA